ncbi:FecCD family ABC transporter permease [Aquibacillus rhizosphaerae]|uniref:Iron ABC transporter permease n=1 Tax=Aquibacillus rhizosphaerae TaxID=3051431 RepID=A0ABT7L8E1_9BACI|nr:iron ABC transporter permease [Aquibacillus sp. LR5S19]MDL4842145.1 iron ABC transporter permease [Aquibacillus sp. LR5S19]
MNKRITFRSNRGYYSFLVEKKTLTVLTMLFVLTGIFLVISVGVGSTIISPIEAMKTLFGYGFDQHTMIIVDLRLPRVTIAILVGAAMAISGGILQGVIRNPLASPDIIGISGGAAFAAVTFITYFSETLSIKWLPLAAFLGALSISIIIYSLAWKKGVTPIRLVLVGIGISTITSSLTTLMIVLSPYSAASQAYIWLTGSIYGSSWEDVIALLPWLIIFIPLAFICGRSINVQELGDDMARSLGSHVQLHRGILVIISVALAGSAVSIGGAIGFVGLIAPHIARKIVGSSFGSLLPVAALIGSLIVILADTVARTAFLPLDIPAGVFTAGIGAPFFIYLLYRNKNF